MKTKLNTRSAFLIVVLYLFFSIAASLLAAIIFGGVRVSQSDTIIDGVIDSGMYATIAIAVALVFVSTKIFRDSSRDIFFERIPFGLSKLYYLFPLAWLGVSLFALFNVDYSSYSAGVILRVIIAALAIGVNEEIVTRGILLVGLRNSGLAEWKAWLVTLVVFTLLHLVNVIGGGGSLTVILVVTTGGTLLYVARRVFNNLFAPIALHAVYDTAFFLLTGLYTVSEGLPDRVLDIQLGSFLLLMVASILFLLFGRGLFTKQPTGW